MLYGVGIGLARQHLTLEAVEIIKKVDEVIVPGKMAYEIIKDIREPRIFEFPMGRSEMVVKELAKEISERDDDIAFCCLGDATLYSTFHHLVKELRRIKPDYPITIIPGISSVSVALAKSMTFVDSPILITTPGKFNADIAAILKVKNPREMEMRLKEMGFFEFKLFENMFMENERICSEMPEKSGYFSILIARRRR